MSRSYKRHVRYRDKSHKYYKRLANRIVRYYKEEIEDGRAYKKILCSYRIHDVDFHVAKVDANYDKLKRK